MNTEELEQSLRAEFEGQLQKIVSQMRQDFVDLQQNFENEFDKHRSQMDEAFRNVSGKIETPVEFDKGFTETVAEHLRLARDEGAQITATALGEAEKLGHEDAGREFELLRASINEIKSNNTQAAILRALVNAASNFAPRGAFFIVKNDHLVGWRVFGSGELVDENTVRSIHFPADSETLLSNSVSSLSLQTGTSAEDTANNRFLEPLGFGTPERMFAVPLVARNRGVAVLYADGGDESGKVNIDALETLVAVAGLRVELLASASLPVPVEAVQPVAAVSQPETEYVGEVAVSEAEAQEAELVSASLAEESESQTTDFALGAVNFADEQTEVSEQASSEPSTAEPELEHKVEMESFPVPEPAPASEPVSEPASEETQTKSYRERTVDLPIEVADDERRDHSDARRFARLLVSEIRLYNEQKVVAARESGDIYEILKEAIDRSREMYEKRVKPEVASKFDYFHFELVNNLADGDEEKLGAGYMTVKA